MSRCKITQRSYFRIYLFFWTCIIWFYIIITTTIILLLLLLAKTHVHGCKCSNCWPSFWLFETDSKQYSKNKKACETLNVCTLIYLCYILLHCDTVVVMYYFCPNPWLFDCYYYYLFNEIEGGKKTVVARYIQEDRALTVVAYNLLYKALGTI